MSSKKEQLTPVSLLQSVVTITEQRDRERLEQALLDTLAEIMPIRRITLYQMISREQGGEAVIVSEKAEDSVSRNIHNGPSFQIAQRLEFGSVIETGKEFVRFVQDENVFQSVYPIHGSGGISGFLEIISGHHSEGDQRIIQAFLKIYSNYLHILLESETDTLTGLLNRRTFDQNIGKIIAERTASDNAALLTPKSHPARRKVSAEASHWLALMDIDHFKKVNDEYGHLYGDEVLVLMARYMRQVFRRRDKLFRFGGEEFVVVLDRTNLKSAREVLERFRKTIAKHNFPQIGKVTVSIGFICLDKAEVPSEMIGHADQALYYAKQHGRNQVCQYEELVAMGKLAGQHYSEDLEIF